MRNFIDIIIGLFWLKKCRKDHFFHDWVYEDVDTERMEGTGQYIEGKEIERKRVYTTHERYCKRCRKHDMQDPLGMWWPLIMPKTFNGEILDYVEVDGKMGFIIKSKQAEDVAENKTVE